MSEKSDILFFSRPNNVLQNRKSSSVFALADRGGICSNGIIRREIGERDGGGIVGSVDKYTVVVVVNIDGIEEGIDQQFPVAGIGPVHAGEFSEEEENKITVHELTFRIAPGIDGAAEGRGGILQLITKSSRASFRTDFFAQPSRRFFAPQE